MPPPLPPRDPDHDQDQHPDHDTVPPPSYDEAVAGAGPASPSDSTAAAIAAASLLDEKRSLPAASYPSSHLAPDPRSSSSQSLVSHPGGDHEEGDIIDNHGALGDTKGRPSTSAGRSQRRTLLLVYIHGFYGNAQSFQSFPYHVHSYLRTALAASHSIHTKIYPRYKTYRAIEIARDNFSQWLEPHEGPDTDVILVGHSMGGILAADVVLMPNESATRAHPFKHRILGTISLDSPFLGLHPGIIVSGLASLFQPAQDGHDQSGEGSMSPPQRQTTMDPTFDPPFFNDNPFRENPFFKRLTNFTNKHMSEGLINASAKHFLSHFEYGSCLADFPALKERYGRIRELEDVDELQGFAAAGDYVHGDEKKQPYPATSTPRVRFVNYYTLSSGRKKQEKQHRGSTPGSESVDSPGPSLSYADTMSTMTTTSTASIASPGIPIEDRGQPIEDTNLEKVQSAGSIDASLDDLSLCDPEPMDEPVPAEKESEKTADVPVKEEDNLPPLPELPAGPPETPDFDQYTDKTVRKQVEKEHKRVRKAYDDAVKAHGKALQERRKLVEKRAKAARKEAKGKQDDDTRSLQGDDDDTNDQDKKQKEKKEKQKEKQKEEKEKQKVKQEMKKEKQLAEKEKAKEEKRQKEERKRAKKEKAKEMPGDDDQEHKDKKRKKFCMLPKRRDGGVDNTWVDVYMDDMDEVAAHCGLFFPGPHYDRLVGDVASRVVGWVEEGLSTRAIREYDGQ